MNFATLQGLTIPEGVVTRITDASGRVLWDSSTTISGSYLINQQKAYDVLQVLAKSKTFNVAFGAGGPPNGGDEMNFTSMTFDATYDRIAYDSIVAFVSYNYMNGGDGFAEYTSNGGTGNGARINFPEGTVVSREVKTRFLSIADIYVDSRITFTIEGSTYQGEANMTWAQWAESNYNQDGFDISNGYFEYSPWRIVDSAGNSQRASDKIIDGAAYAIDWGNTN